MKLIATKKKIDNDFFKITLGTTNKKRPITFYIEFNCISSISDKKCARNDLTAKLSYEVKRISASITKQYSMEKCAISDVSFSEESLKDGKDTYFTIQFYFMQLLTKDFNTLLKICEKIADEYSEIIKRKLNDYNIEIRKIK